MAMRNNVKRAPLNTKSRCANFAKETSKLVKFRSYQCRPGRSIDEVRSKSVKEVLSKDFERHLPGLRYLADR